ncbi:hypothetical protein AbraIFM66950_011900 [Aspergillus brasiliensis]|nr:hypothetical protein AbraIFM66950_011900 [Aspergillus brasiliensis]
MATNTGNQRLWSQEFACLAGVLTHAHLVNAEEHQRRWAHMYAWKSSLATVIHDLLRPGSLLSAEHPILHEVLSRRYFASMQARGEAEVSKCTHLIDGLYGTVRTDSYRYQQYVRSGGSTIRSQSRGGVNVPDEYRANLCPTLLDEFVLRGILGRGTYGVVFLAHKRHDPRSAGSQKLYAIKAEAISTVNTDLRRATSPSVAPLYYPMPHHFRYIPTEAYILLLADGCKRFPTLDSVYSHGKYQATVMEAVETKAVREEPYDPYAPTSVWRKFMLNPKSGSSLVTDKKTDASEVDACMIATQLLEATAYLYDMRLCHTDISHVNYLLDDEHNTTLIDLGLVHFGLRDGDFQKSSTPYIANYEKFMTPELAMELLKPEHNNVGLGSDTTLIPFRHDVRHLTIWQLGCIIYEVLHGFAPWEDPHWDPTIERIVRWNKGSNAAERARRMRKLRQRRMRIINEELPISAKLSQDCMDMLRVMLAKYRKKRPKLYEVLSLRWFGQHSFREGREISKKRRAVALGRIRQIRKSPRISRDSRISS